MSTGADGSNLGETPCCRARFGSRPVSASPRLVVRRCESCKLLWAYHVDLATGKPWDDAYLSDEFVRALRDRREKQASTIVDVLRKHNAPQPILDYGSGQGVLLKQLVNAGLDAWGCDLDADIPLAAAAKDRTLHVSVPWDVPSGDWKTVVMLDVLEHHPTPVEFLRHLPGESLLLKVPTATGPAALLARLLARVGRPGQLELLFLVGENAPHHWLATPGGLTSLARAAGWSRAWRGTVPEVGSELPERMRPRPASRGVRMIARAAGTTTAALSRVWSDTEIQFFVRSKDSTNTVHDGATSQVVGIDD